jgi:hypothetical protein
MSTKTFLFALFGIIVISGAVYFAPPKKIQEKVADTFQQQKALTKISEGKASSSAPLFSQEPSKNSSSGEIIDYIVDGLIKDEMTAVEKVMDTLTLPLSKEATISTNF